jgi:ABC-type multidrug transport system fused ATPase/permease subunit
MCKIPTENYLNLKEEEKFLLKNIKKPVTKFLSIKSSSPRPLTQILSYTEINQFGFNKRLFLKGKIEFRDIFATYENQTQHALKGISLVIESGEKIGICGRTGSGKSSLIKLLTRSLEH